MRLLALIFFIVTVSYQSLLAQPLQANAGNGKTICYGQVTVLGGAPSATGGMPPYTYAWEPIANVSSPTIANPAAVGLTQGTYFRLIVIDKNNDTDTSYIFIDVDQIYTYSAGIDTGYCYPQTTGVTIGAPNNGNNASNFTFSWLPAIGLDNASLPNPIASTMVTTKYTLIVSDGKCPNNTSDATITPFASPVIDASPDTVIHEGQVITLNGTGSNINYWSPDYRIKYNTSVSPDVWPIIDTTYYLLAKNSHGCSSLDSVRVRVIKSDSLYFYSAFTPNNDGENDYFFVANLQKFPDNIFKVFNRYGKLIFNANGYDNTWDGTYLGTKIPDGIYFYILDDGVSKKYKGTVTILR